MVENPRDLGGGEIGIEQQARARGDKRLRALRLQSGADIRRATVLPDDGVVDGSARGALPDERRLALVGDADGRDIARRHAALRQRAAHGGERRAPDVFRIVLDLARRRIMLRELLLRDARHRQVRPEQDGARGCGALIDGEEIARHDKSSPVGRAPGARFGHEGRERGGAGGVDEQSEFRASPQHVPGRARPFLIDQVADFGLRQRRAEMRAEIGEGLRAAEHARRARSIGAGQTRGMVLREKGEARAQIGDNARKAIAREIAAGQRRVARPRRAEIRQPWREFVESGLGEAAVCRQLAADDRQQRRPARFRIEIEHVIARRRFGVAGAVVGQRPHAGEGPDDIGRREASHEIFVRRVAEIGDLRVAGARRARVAVEIAIGRADQREIVEIGNGEDDAAVAGLENIGESVVEQFAHDDMCALHEAHRRARARRRLVQRPRDPGAGGIDENAGADVAARACLRLLHRQRPDVADAARGDGFRARGDGRAALGGVARIGDDEARVVDAAVGIFEAPGEQAGLQRAARDMAREIEPA
jgi:hypothetical protein